jgi:hypothetical protein
MKECWPTLKRDIGRGNILQSQTIPLESKEVAVMLAAVPNAFAKHAAKEKSPSPTSSIL